MQHGDAIRALSSVYHSPAGQRISTVLIDYISLSVAIRVMEGNSQTQKGSQCELQVADACIFPQNNMPYSGKVLHLLFCSWFRQI